MFRCSGKTTIVTTLCLILMSSFFVGCEEEGGESNVIRVATVLKEEHPSAAALLAFRDELKDLSRGRLKAVVLFNSQLGDANETMKACQDGELELSQISIANIARVAPAANALAMPFIWEDAEHQERALDGSVGEVIREAVLPYDFEVLGFFSAGTRNFSTKKGPIKTPEDLSGMKIRVIDSPLMLDMVEAIGAEAVPMDQSEVYGALKSGEIDGWENNPITIATFRMYETGCNHFAWTRHTSIPDVFIAGKPFMNGLTSQEQEWVREAARNTVDTQRELWRDSEEKMLNEMTKNGMIINEDVDIPAFRAKVEPIYDRYVEKHGDTFAELCETIRELETGVPDGSAPTTEPSE